MTVPIWIQYAVYIVALLLIALGVTLAILGARYERRARRRYGGDVTEAVAREIRFFDDQADPRDLIA